MASTFSTQAEDAFTRVVEVQQETELEDLDIERNFQTEKIISFLKRKLYEKVALQFPDEYLKYSFKIVKIIQEELKLVKLFILGDTTYGSCCVDEIAAEHVGAECIIHFGRACLSKTSRLPVLFIFGESFIDVRDFGSKFKETFPSNSSPFILFYDVSYQHAIDEICTVLEEEYKNLTVSKLLTDENTESCQYCSEKNMISNEKLAIGCCNDKNSCISGECLGLKELNKGNFNSTASCSCRNSEQESGKVHKRFGRMFVLPSETNLEECSMLYIGKQSLTLTNLMMSYNRNTFYTYDPNIRVMQKESLNVNKALMKRYFLMQKAKEAKTVGIVAGTLGVADYMSIIERLKNLLRKNGKKYYVFMMGKPNVAKMANFMEIDVFVLVACPENSLIDSQEFYRPIVTPFEMEIACSCGREWTGEYITDFRELLPGAASFVDFEAKEQIEKEQEPEFSLISGNLIHKNDHYKEEKGNSTEVVLKNQENAVAMFGENSSASFLYTRSWKGLERKLGETEIVDAIEGRTGIAIQYTHETNTSNSSDSKDFCNN